MSFRPSQCSAALISTAHAFGAGPSVLQSLAAHLRIARLRASLRAITAAGHGPILLQSPVSFGIVVFEAHPARPYRHPSDCIRAIGLLVRCQSVAEQPPNVCHRLASAGSSSAHKAQRTPLASKPRRSIKESVGVPSLLFLLLLITQPRPQPGPPAAQPAPSASKPPRPSSDYLLSHSQPPLDP